MANFKIIAIIISSLLFFFNYSVYSAKPIIVDTDMGIDDVIALLYLLKNPNVDIQAVTIACDGNAHCKPATENIIRILHMMGKSNIPVGVGEITPLSHHHQFPEEILQEADTLARTDVFLPRLNTVRNRPKAVPLLVNTINGSTRPVTILALGPLTNIAQAVKQNGEIKKNIKSIYIMGGALHVEGNIHLIDPKIKNEVSEWNFYLDPLAAEIIFKQKIPTYLVPLDATNQVPIDMAVYNKLKDNHHTLAANYVFRLINSNLAMLKAGKWFFWDPLAAVIACNSSVAKFKKEKINIVLNPEDFSGATVITKSGYEINVVTEVNQKRFKIDLLSHLTR